MQDFGTVPGITHQVDLPQALAYNALVTKDTTLDSEHPERIDIAENGVAASELSSDPAPQDYYAARRAHFVAAVKGFLPLSEYVREVAADVDRRFPPLAQE